MPMLNLTKTETELTSVKLNGSVNATVTLPGNEKDIKKFLAFENLDDYLLVEQE